jgi:hypothetical protein
MTGDYMKRSIAHLRESLILISAIVLILGLISAGFIYLTAGDDAGTILGYEITGGTVYPVSPEDSKVYRRDLEHVGGKAAIVADDFSRWFGGLWQGKSLAFTIAFISTFISFIIFFVANRLPFLLKANVDDENKWE